MANIKLDEMGKKFDMLIILPVATTDLRLLAICREFALE